MIYILLCAQCLLGMTHNCLSPITVEAMKERGLPSSDFDLPTAIDFAFSHKDVDLINAIGESLWMPPYSIDCADQVLRLYSILPEGDFRSSIAVVIAYSLVHEKRIAQSRWGCEFYKTAMAFLKNPQPKGRNRGRSITCLERLSKYCSLPLSPYVAWCLLGTPGKDPFIVSCAMVLLEKNVEGITPERAYHIYKRYGSKECYAETLAPVATMAAPLLNAKELPPEASLDRVVEGLQKEIEEAGKVLCDKYSSIDPAPLPPRPTYSGSGGMRP